MRLDTDTLERGAVPPRPLLARATMVLEHPMDFAWTVQGFGMIRTYLDPDKRYRLNVWSRALRVPNVSDIHDHPWDFRSWVLCGQIRNIRFRECPPAPDGKRTDMALPFQHVEIKTGEGGGPTGPVDVRYLECVRPETYEPGETYHQGRLEIHRTEALDGTVTLNDRTPPTPEHTANIYWPRGPWVNAEPRAATKAEVYAAIEEAVYQARLAKFRRFS